MNGPLNSAVTGSFSHTLTAISDQGLTDMPSGANLQLTEFAQLLASQDKVPELLKQLKGLLPEQDFEQIESLLMDGNSLPQAALTVTPEEQPVPAAPLSPPGIVNPWLPEGDMRFREGRMGFSEGRLRLPEPGLRFPEVAQPGMKPASSEPSDTMIINRLLPESVAGQPSGEAVPKPAAFTVAEGGPPLPLVKPLAQDSAGLVQASPLAVHSAPQAISEAGLPTMRPLHTGPADLDVPLAAKGWDKALSERVLWMVGRSVQGASLRITPPNLGPVEIQLSLQQDQATVNFNAPHAATREALEASIPRLREMFLENNMQLVNVDVAGRENDGQRSLANGYQDGRTAVEPQSSEQGEDEQRQETPSSRQTTSGLLDDYA